MTAIDYRNQITVVTGASSGLGTEFATQLAARGSHLVLVARRVDRLDELAARLTADHGVTVTVVARDLAAPDAGRTLAAELTSRGIRPTGLVNNAGFGTHDTLADDDPDLLQSMITLNVNALVDLSRAYIGQFAAEGGFLINVASVLGYQPTPYLSTYGATKAFVLHFTEGLWEEVRGTRARVLALSPGAVDTAFFDTAGAASDYGTSRATPQKVVAVALDALGKRSSPPSVISNGRPLAVLTKILPRSATVRLMGLLQRRAMA